MTIGEALAESIREKGMKQRFVAEKAGISPQRLSEICKGRRRMEVVECFNICAVMGIDVNELRRKIIPEA